MYCNILAPAYRLYILLLRACASYNDFSNRGLILTRKLMYQEFANKRYASLLQDNLTVAKFTNYLTYLSTVVTSNTFITCFFLLHVNLMNYRQQFTRNYTVHNPLKMWVVSFWHIFHILSF